MEGFYAKKRMRWGSIGFFAGLTLVTFIGLPLYLASGNAKPIDFVLLTAFYFLTTLAITVGYHRLYSHRAFNAHPIVRFMVLFFGAAAIQQSALKWSALHRQHHRYTDTPRDPYNIKQGFFHAHMGWLLFSKHSVDYDGVKDLKQSRLVRLQHDHFQWWAVTAGVALPVAIGAVYGSILGAFLFGVAGRLFLAYHSTFFINSAAHMFGTQKFGETTSARDHWVCALLTNGEGYHNFHHRFPSDYRNGIRWYHWDPSKWIIWILGRLGLVWNINVTPVERIRES